MNAFMKLLNTIYHKHGFTALIAIISLIIATFAIAINYTLLRHIFL